LPSLIWGQEQLHTAAGAPLSWLWQGYLLPGALTLLTASWKAGKTTLISVLLARRPAGGLFAGLPLTPGRSIVVTEESLDHWRRRARTLDFGEQVGWFCRPFGGRRPTRRQWLAFIDQIGEVSVSKAIDLMVIDPLASFMAGTSENDAGSMLDTLLPLQRLTSAGLAVLVAHHPRRQKSPAGHAARGSGALSGFADILIEMRSPGGLARGDNRRRLLAFSRYPETPRDCVISRSADGTDYLALGSYTEVELARGWLMLEAVLAQAAGPLTRDEIRQAWPSKAPDAERVGAWLEQAVLQGRLRKAGRGVKNNPYRYWLPSREEVWRKDPLAFIHFPELFG
jgi:hypothetical protein